MRSESKGSAVDRRAFLSASATAAAAAALTGPAVAGELLMPPARNKPLFQISLAEWSLHRTLDRGNPDDNLGFPARAKAMGIDAVEYVNAFFKAKAKDADYLKELRKRCADAGVESLLIMCDGEGALGDPDEARRKQAVENHHKWIDAAKELGCHSIRVNAQSRGTWQEQHDLAVEGLGLLTEYGAKMECNVIVENHGGLSSNGAWLSGVLKAVDEPRCGALPDFGNFQVKKGEVYDRYQGVDELMPFAKGVSAKSHEFDDAGDEVRTDYRKMLKIVCGKHGWRGHIGIEFEGGGSEEEGILKTKRLLEAVRGELEKELEK